MGRTKRRRFIDQWRVRLLMQANNAPLQYLGVTTSVQMRRLYLRMLKLEDNLLRTFIEVNLRKQFYAIMAIPISFSSTWIWLPHYEKASQDRSYHSIGGSKIHGKKRICWALSVQSE